MLWNKITDRGSAWKFLKLEILKYMVAEDIKWMLCLQKPDPGPYADPHEY